MKIKSNIRSALLRKAGCIAFILLISVNFAFGNVISNHCQSDPDCANCIAAVHSHMPGTMAEMENNTCSSGDKNTTCGYETGAVPEGANRIALTVRSNPHELSGFIVAGSDINTRPNPSGTVSLQFDSPPANGTIPIYLLNDCLLC